MFNTQVKTEDRIMEPIWDFEENKAEIYAIKVVKMHKEGVSKGTLSFLLYQLVA